MNVPQLLTELVSTLTGSLCLNYVPLGKRVAEHHASTDEQRQNERIQH